MTTHYGLVSGARGGGAAASLEAKLEETRAFLEEIRNSEGSIERANRRIRDAVEGTANEVVADGEELYPLEESDDDDDAE